MPRLLHPNFDPERAKRSSIRPFGTKVTSEIGKSRTYRRLLSRQVSLRNARYSSLCRNAFSRSRCVQLLFITCMSPTAKP